MFFSNLFRYSLSIISIATILGSILLPSISSATYIPSSVLGISDGYSLDAADGSPTDALYVDNDGNVGIGTTRPTEALDVTGSIKASEKAAFGGYSIDDTFYVTTPSLYSNTGEFTNLCIGDGSSAGNCKTSWSEVVSAGGGGLWSSATGGINYNGGNVGIGTSNPIDKLNINAIPYGNNQDGGIRLNSYHTDGTEMWAARVALKSNNNGVPRLALDDPKGAETVAIVDGNVGIGTTNPTAELEVNGFIKWGDKRNLLSTNQGGSIELGGDSGDSANPYTPYIDFHNDSTSDHDMRLILLNDDTLEVSGGNLAVDGNVGIGTTTPTEKLEVDGNIKASGTICTASNCLDTLATNITNGTGGKFLDGSDTTQTGEIYYNGGNVGIGTTSPERALHIQGTGDISDDVIIEANSDTNANNAGLLAIYRSRGNSTTKTKVLANDKLGVLSFRGYTGSVYTTGAAIEAIATGNFDTDKDTSLLFQTSNSSGSIENRIIITGSGNVGIGTTTPTEKLDVDGNIKSSGKASFGGYDVDTNFDVTTPSLYAEKGEFTNLCIGDGSSAGNCKSSWNEVVSAGGGGLWSSTTEGINYNGGNVGIGTTTPESTLDVNGSISTRGIENSNVTVSYNILKKIETTVTNEAGMTNYGITLGNGRCSCDTNSSTLSDCSSQTVVTNTGDYCYNQFIDQNDSTTKYHLYSVVNTGETYTYDVKNEFTVTGNHIFDGGLDYGITVNSYEPAINLIDRSNNSGSVQLYGVSSGGLWLRGNSKNLGNIGASPDDYDIAKFEKSNITFYTDDVKRIIIDDKGVIQQDLGYNNWNLWIQGSHSNDTTSTGKPRNIALIGAKNIYTDQSGNEYDGDFLLLNYQGEYTGGVGVGTWITTGNMHSPTGLAIGDSDTGLKQEGDGKLGFYTNNTQRLFINDDGNIGIGIDHPSSKLQVYEDGRILGTSFKDGNGTFPGMTIKGGSDFVGMTLVDRDVNGDGAIDTNDKDGVLYWGDDVADNLRFMHMNAENSHIADTKMIITGNGNIGIGTDTPTAKLDVNGEIHAQNANGETIYIGGDANGSDIEVGSTTSGITNISFFNRTDVAPMNIKAAKVIAYNVIKTTGQSTAPTCSGTNDAGSIYFNSTNKKFYGCDGSSWIAFH